MNTCQHDPQFRIENEANGGAGCPLCRAERNTQRGIENVMDERGQGCAGNSADEYDSSTEGHW